jgi:hypothetical protein
MMIAWLAVYMCLCLGVYHADSKHLHHLLRQDKTESLHRNEQDAAIEIGLGLMLEELGTTH